MTVRNDIGDLRLQSQGSKGLTVTKTTGDVTIDGAITVSSTTAGTAASGALKVLGGISAAGSSYIAGDLVVTGNVVATGSTITPTVSTVPADLVNVSAITVYKSTVTVSNSQYLLAVNFKVTPTAGSLNTQFTFNLPDRNTAFGDSLDMDTGQCSGFTDTVNFIVLQNTLCTGVVGSTKAMVKFQSQSTNIHYLQVLVSYAAV